MATYGVLSTALRRSFEQYRADHPVDGEVAMDGMVVGRPLGSASRRAVTVQVAAIAGFIGFLLGLGLLDFSSIAEPLALGGAVGVVVRPPGRVAGDAPATIWVTTSSLSHLPCLTDR